MKGHIASSLAVMALALPGAKLGDRALAKEGPEANRDWRVHEGVGYCDVEPPNASFVGATCGSA